MSETRTIPLTQGQVAIVDAEDYEWLSQWKWNAVWMPCTRSFYAVRRSRVSEGKPTYRVWMHREILGLKRGDGLFGDHRESGQTLDNRRENLRIATRAQNSTNSRMPRDSFSGIKGLSWHKKRQRWVVRIRVNGKLIHLGEFKEDDKDRAISAYRDSVAHYHGEFGRTA